MSKQLTPEQMQSMLEQLMRDNQDLRQQMKEQETSISSKLREMNPEKTTMRRMLSKQFIKLIPKVVLNDEPQESASTGQLMEMKKDCCPYCVAKKRPNIVDLDGARWQCRVCGKHWLEEALGKPYTKKLEEFSVNEIASEAI